MIPAGENTMPVAELLAAGRRWHESGDLPRAEEAYRQLLGIDPQNAELWYLLGTVYQGRDKPGEAIEAFGRAATLKPAFAQAHNSLGIALARQGQREQAAECFQAAVRSQPDFAHAHNNLANVLKEMGRREEALSAYQQAVRLKGDFAEAHNNLGNLQREMGQLDDAVANCRQALRLKPDLADAHNNLGAAYAARREWDEAVACYRQALALRGGYAEAENNLGGALQELGRYDEAVAHFREALRLRPEFAEAHGGLAMALVRLDELDAAEATCREALRLKPDLATAHLSLGFILSEQGRREAALACCQRALDLQPDLADARKNRSLIWLLEGKLTEGWAEYEWRWKCPELPERPFGQPLWDGSPLAGQTLLLHAEQGLGDTLQFIRYAPLAAERGARVVVACQRPLLPLLSRMPGVSGWVAQGDPLPPFDLHAPLMSLPRIFGTTLENVPAAAPYLAADAALVERWRGELAVIDGFRIGIAWQGSRNYRRDRYRSVPLEQFAPLAEVPGVRLISLQKGYGAEQVAALGGRFEVIDLADRLDAAGGAFMDTAAVMTLVDLVITSDTAVPHLAGALGVPVWVALSSNPDWRWLLDREDSPWYPTMRLFRQTQRGEWSEVFDRMAGALAERLGTVRPLGPLAVEVAAGELLDKITILEIKSERISDAAKLANVHRELAALAAARERVLRRGGLAELIAELKGVNEALWEIEDELRVLERQRDFGPRFIELARSVYHQNDRRAAVKRRINEALGSRLIEEKSYQSYE
jgi:tetratricopeptide (TPR) repeat protein